MRTPVFSIYHKSNFNPSPTCREVSRYPLLPAFCHLGTESRKSFTQGMVPWFELVDLYGIIKAQHETLLGFHKDQTMCPPLPPFTSFPRSFPSTPVWLAQDEGSLKVTPASTCHHLNTQYTSSVLPLANCLYYSGSYHPSSSCQ